MPPPPRGAQSAGLPSDLQAHIFHLTQKGLRGPLRPLKCCPPLLFYYTLSYSLIAAQKTLLASCVSHRSAEKDRSNLTLKISNCTTLFCKRKQLFLRVTLLIHCKAHCQNF